MPFNSSCRNQNGLGVFIVRLWVLHRSLTALASTPLLVQYREIVSLPHIRCSARKVQSHSETEALLGPLFRLDGRFPPLVEHVCPNNAKTAVFATVFLRLVLLRPGLTIHKNTVGQISGCFGYFSKCRHPRNNFSFRHFPEVAFHDHHRHHLVPCHVPFPYLYHLGSSSLRWH